jgi:uncharacterized phage infection (PIP) family protein YhgE
MPDGLPTFDIMIIQSSLAEMTRRVTEIETDIQRINEVINGHAREQAVFAYRHDQAKQISDKLEQIVERINERGEDELRKTIELIDTREARLADSITTHKEIVLKEVALQHQTLKQSIEQLQSSVTDLAKNLSDSAKDMLSVKKWMWTIGGGIATLVALANWVIPFFVK